MAPGSWARRNSCGTGCKRSAYLLHGLRDVLGEFGSRLPLAALFLFAAYAASKTAWMRFKN
jgi:hypothetical protein